MAKQSAPIKWHGGKSYLASQIIELMPDHTHYVEPYFGGGAVLFNKPFIGYSEVINDIYGDLINFWKVLQSKILFQEFKLRVSLIPFSKPTFEDAREATSFDLPEDAECNDVDRAVLFFIRFRQSRQGLGEDFATMSRTRTRRSMNEQVSAWLSAIDGLDIAHKRLQRVVIFRESAIKVIEREDDQHTFFYCDPTYLSDTRTAKDTYSYEMTAAQHIILLKTLGAIRGKFIISGYPHKIYTYAAAKFGWNCKEIQIDNKASSQKIKPIKTECLWYNYDDCRSKTGSIRTAVN